VTRLAQLNLSDCGDVLTIQHLCAVLQICPSEYYKLKAHCVFPIPALPNLGSAVRYSKASVQRYLDAVQIQRHTHDRQTRQPWVTSSSRPHLKAAK
jgi:hypothetical protein